MPEAATRAPPTAGTGPTVSTMTTLPQAKNAARVLRASLAADGLDISHSRALELVSRQLGYDDWNTAHAALTRTTSDLGAAVPVLRVQDWSAAEPFYRGYLGFGVAWVHRHEAGLPVYVRVTRDAAVLDLSEHHGDGTPGSVAWVPLRDLAAYHRELGGRGHARLRPGIDDEAPGGPTMTIVDPFGNTLRFCQPAG